MLDLTFEPQGHDRLIFGDAEQLIAQLSRKASRIRCVSHGSRLELQVLRHDPDEAELLVRGCCTEVIERAERALR